MSLFRAMRRWRGEMRAPAIRGRDEGFAMLLVLVVVAALSLLGIVGTRSAQTELRIAEKDLQGKQALSTAEAGISHAFALLKSTTGLTNELSNGGTGGVLANLGSLASVSGTNYRFKQLGTGTNDGYYVRAIDNWDEQTGTNDPNTDQDNRVQILSRGRVGSAERVIAVSVRIKPGSGPGFFGNLFFPLTGGSIVDSFDSSLGPYSVSKGDAGDIRSNGDVTLSGGLTQVRGKATAGGKVNTSGGASVTGTSTNGASKLSFPPVPACGPPYSTGTGVSGGKYDKTKGTWTIGGGNTGTLTPGTYCFSSVTVSGSGSLHITGATQMYVTAKVNISGNPLAIVNETGIPADFQISSSYYAPNDQNGVVVSGGSGAAMKIYAPTTGITISGGSDFYGSIIGGSVTASGGTRLHYDVSLGGGGGANPTLSGWHEVRN